MNFTKMHGLGNDFIVIAEENKLPHSVSDLALRLCSRNFGVGADGLVYILPSGRADFMMRIINADGSEAEQCGNAIRCAAKYIYDHGMSDKTELKIETIGAGVQPVQLTLQEGKAVKVRVDMGEPVLKGTEVPTTVDAEPVLNHPVEADGREFAFTAVSMGNPHCVIFLLMMRSALIFILGVQCWNGTRCSREKTNVEFTTVRSRSHLDMRVWERGAGPTLACGTGACAALVASVLHGLTDRKATVSLKGGDLLIEWNETDNRVYMTGPAEEVFRGSL